MLNSVEYLLFFKFEEEIKALKEAFDRYVAFVKGGPDTLYTQQDRQFMISLARLFQAINFSKKDLPSEALKDFVFDLINFSEKLDLEDIINLFKEVKDWSNLNVKKVVSLESTLRGLEAVKFNIDALVIFWESIGENEESLHTYLKSESFKISSCFGIRDVAIAWIKTEALKEA